MVIKHERFINAKIHTGSSTSDISDCGANGDASVGPFLFSASEKQLNIVKMFILNGNISKIHIFIKLYHDLWQIQLVA